MTMTKGTLPHYRVEEYQEFAHERLGVEFKDINLLITALTHRSYVNEHASENCSNNERLEFLGDAVLELVVSDFLYRKFNRAEGIMTTWRAALVRTESNAAAGRRLGYEPLIRLSKGERRSGNHIRESIVADCYEATLGAVYLDQGYEAARRIIEEYSLVNISKVIHKHLWLDTKSRVQEVVQHKFNAVPVYRVLRENGPDHEKRYRIGIYVKGHLYGSGSGHSKQEAQSAAAEAALHRFSPEDIEAACGIGFEIDPAELQNSKQGPKPDSKPEPKPDAKQNPAQSSKPDAEPELKPDSKPDAKPDAK